MPENIESFVARLHRDGVEAGREEAEKLKAEAEKEGASLVAAAKAEAERIVADAKAEAANTLARSKTDLELAVRDAQARLREALGQMIAKILNQSVHDVLNDGEFLCSLIHDVVQRYADADTGESNCMTITVSEEMEKKLADWAITELRKASEEGRGGLDLKDGLRQAGFEYTTESGTVEVTEESVTTVLAELIAPRLQKFLEGSESTS